MCTTLNKLWLPGDKITQINIVGINNPTALNEARAQRMFDGAFVVITNKATAPQQWYNVDPNDDNSIYLNAPGFAAHYLVRYVNGVLAPDGRKVFQLIWRNNGNFISHYNHNDVFQASGEARDIWQSYFSFVYDSSGQINNMITYSPNGMGNNYTLSPYQSPSENNYMKADWNNAERFDCNLWLQLNIVSPSNYLLILRKIFNPLSCCSSVAKDNSIQMICDDQGLTSYNSPQCYNYFSQACFGDKLLSPECINYCSQKDVNCDDALQKFAAQKPELLQTNSDVVACFQTPTFYSTFFNSLTSKVPALAGLPLFPYCSFPACAVPSALKPFNVKNQNTPPCPNLTTCVSTVNVDVKGQIIGNVPISQNLACKSISQGAVSVAPANSTPASTNSTPYPPSTPAPVPVPAVSVLPSSSTATSTDTSYQTGIIISIVVFVLLLLLGAYWLHKRKKSSANPPTKPPPTPTGNDLSGLL